MSQIFLIRHGQASFGEENYDRLSETGRRQASLTAEYFLKSGIAFDSFYCGTLNRQRDTLQEMITVFRKSGQKVSEPILMKEFNEYDSMSLLKFFVPVILEKYPALKGDFDNALKNKKSFQKIYERVISEWCSGKYNSSEFITWEDFCAEVISGLSDVMQSHGSGKKIAVVTSGGPVSAITGMALGIDPVKTLRLGWEILNASFTRLKCTENEFSLSSFNEYSHLEIYNDQSLITYR